MEFMAAVRLYSESLSVKKHKPINDHNNESLIDSYRRRPLFFVSLCTEVA